MLDIRAFRSTRWPETHAAQHYGGTLDDGGWQEMLRDGTPIKIMPDSSEWLHVKAFVTRDGTFAYLSSQGLATDDLAMIATSLRPASKTDAI